MQTFFHGWRRKTGVGTLVFASLVLAGWIRSLLIEHYVGDVAAFSLGGCRNVIATYPNQFAWWIWSEAETDHIAVIVNFSEFATRSIPWDAQRAFAIETQAPQHIWRGTVPYWSIVIPATLLSAYLILWKPQKRRDGSV